MHERKPNQFARVVALFTLGVAFLLVLVTIASSFGDGGDSGDSGDDGEEQSDSGGPTAKGQRAIDDGVWVVGEGDTLVSISEETAIELDQLIELNPDIDPQALITGQRISLKAGAIESTDEDSNAGSSDGVTSEGTGVGDGGPSGSGSGAADGTFSD